MSSIIIGEVSSTCHLVQFFGYGVDYVSFSYLGLTVGDYFKCNDGFSVVERFNQRKSQLLSKEGRLTLLQSTLWSPPIYFMLLFVVLPGISSQL